jgi:hypothetical protein
MTSAIFTCTAFSALMHDGHAAAAHDAMRRLRYEPRDLGRSCCRGACLAGFGDTKIGLIILHPWAKLGGTMDDPVVLGMYK